MTSAQITTSVALFYPTEQGDTIPSSWYERALELFREHRLSPVLFTAGGGEFELDGCYVLADRGGDLFKWGEPIAARRDELIDAFQKEVVYTLALDSPQASARDRSEWRAKMSASSIRNKLYVGIDEELVSDPALLLHRACEIARGLFDVRYGFAYKMPLAEEPDCYASGSRPFSFADFQEEMRLRREGVPRQESPDELWGDELMGPRRHLTGLFRGAYPVNVLSESHVRSAELNSRGIGRLSELGTSLWLWELSETEIPKAQALLEARKLLVSQASPP